MCQFSRLINAKTVRTKIIYVSLYLLSTVELVFLNWYKPKTSPLFFVVPSMWGMLGSMIHLTYRELWISFKMLDRMPCSSNFKLDWNKRKKRDIILHWQIASLSKHQAQKDLIYWRILNFKVLFSAFQLSKINIFWKTCHFTLVREYKVRTNPVM